MSDLQTLFSDLGFFGARTVLQTGNVVFEAPPGDDKAMENRLEAECSKRLGLDPDFLIRSDADWGGVIARNPFPGFASVSPASMVVAFAKDAPDPDAIAALEAATEGQPERLKVNGREIYIIYPNGQGRSKLSLSKIERKHPSVRATARNWNTVLKIAALVRA
jgi:uncharacterized protein (DUF1697 family)